VAQYSYLSPDDAIKRSLLPRVVFDDIESVEPGWLQTALQDLSGSIDARLAKRYAVPFNLTDPPAIIRTWLVAMVDHMAWLKRGVSPVNEHFPAIEQRATKAEEQLKEAADSRDGLFDLPLQDGAASAVVARAPIGYAEDVYGEAVL
jgi:hypothetical protein